MDFLSTHTALTDVLHALSQALLAPDIILLLAFACYAVFCIGSVIAEYFTERRNFKVAMPKFLAALMAADEEDIPAVITESGLLNRQKIALLTVYDYRTLPGDAMVALIRRTVNQEETRYDRITGRNNMAAKISPMLGLMGTLIPLGPGIAALGQADTAALSSSLLVAFDTTVAGLIVAAICLAVGKIRSNWYNDYLSALDSGMATMLQKIENMREEGTLTAEEPTDYAFMFEQSITKDKAKTNGAKAAAQLAEDVAEESGVATKAEQAAEVKQAADDAIANEASAAQEAEAVAAAPAVEAAPAAAAAAAAPAAAPAAAVAAAAAPTLEIPQIEVSAEKTPALANQVPVIAGEPLAGGKADAAVEVPAGSRMAARLMGRHTGSADASATGTK